MCLCEDLNEAKTLGRKSSALEDTNKGLNDMFQFTEETYQELVEIFRELKHKNLYEICRKEHCALKQMRTE